MADLEGSQRVVERAARESYGRLIAYLAARSHDLATAEDALSEAFKNALERWPEDGVPENPEAWLLTAARRKLIDQARRRKTHAAAVPELAAICSAAEHSREDGANFPDERIKLFFVCAHPAIDPAVRTPLMLQTVLGLNAATIASAFLVTPATMSQRLVRAKAKIQAARIGFRIPDAEELPDRLAAVLETIYAAFGLGWEISGDAAGNANQLADEAQWLARIVLRLLPNSAEAQGLLSLLLFCESRRSARRDADGNYVPLSQQNTALWSAPLIAEAESLLIEAASLRQIGHFQIEAAIQSAHAERRITQTVNWPEIVKLYGVLLALSPTIGAEIGRAAAVAEAVGAEEGLELLDALDANSVLKYQPYWALRAHLLRRLRRREESHAALTLAIGLTEDDCLRRFLITQANAEDEIAEVRTNS